jgi:hypothetical protein
MGLFDLFRRKPKPCTACGILSPGLHRVYSGIAGGEETDRLCTTCLIAQLEPHLRGKSIVFIEPLTTDGYVYWPLVAMQERLAQRRAELALASLGPKCAACSSPPRHLWMPQEDLDEEAMETLSRRDYWSIPSEPAAWKSTLPLCDEHILSQLRVYIEQRRYYFLTFRFPDSTECGYYW